MSGTASAHQAAVRVLISYARADGLDAATRLRAELERADFDLWRDIEEMRGGENWQDQIRAALHDVDGVVLLLTPGSVASPVVAWERKTALELGKPVIHVLIQSCELPPDLKSSHYHRLDGPESYSLGFAALVRDLRKLANADPGLLVPGTGQLPPVAAPSKLLTARYEVVGFEHEARADILAELNRWSKNAPGLAIRLLHAEGGAGKTRLAIEWARQLRDAGWAAGFLAPDP